MNYADILSNPARIRIMQYIAIHKEATVKELADHLPDIPRRTLYRHVDFLIDAGTIVVKEERRVRGAFERILKDNSEAFVDSCDLSESAYSFFMNLYSKFDSFNKKPHKNFKEEFMKDYLCFGTSFLYLNDDEMHAMMDELSEIPIKYEKAHNEKYGEGATGKLRSISFVSAPVE